LLTFPVIEALRTYVPNPYVMLVGKKVVLPLAHAFELAEEVFDYEEPLRAACSQHHPLTSGQIMPMNKII
jgi:hypothetical protein